MLRHSKVALGLLPVAAGAIYAARGEYFTSGRAADLVIGVVVAAAATIALAYAVLWNATLGRRRARTWAAATVAPVALATILTAFAEPLSPGCTCGGPHRGCCSWHGGVAGCQ